jgi:hypothetical protein
MNFVDNTGKPVSRRDIEDAIGAVRTAMAKHFVTLPPELAVQLPNIHRCLGELLRTK